MALDAEGTIKCFEENRKLFGDPTKDPEKHNLYQGLAGLADLIFLIRAELRVLSHEIASLRDQVDKLKT